MLEGTALAIASATTLAFAEVTQAMVDPDPLKKPP
jgi:hypothetical protein